MSDIIKELRQPVATSFEPDCVEQVVTEMYRRGLKAADIIEQQQKRIAELEAEVSNTEQRTAEACAKLCDEQYAELDDTWDRQKDASGVCSEAIRNGEWREYL